MNKAATGIAAGVVALVLTGPGVAWAKPISQTDVADDAAGICSSLYLALDPVHPPNVINNLLMSLQIKYDASREQVVAEIRQAALGYCPEYLAAVPSR